MGTIKRNFYNNITPTGKFDSADLTGTIPATNVADASLTNITSVPASVGDFVQKVASDPTPVGAGDVWYNTTSNALKSVLALEAWSSGAPLITGRQNLAGAGTQTSSLAFAGATPTLSTATEEYNGSGWSNGGSLGTARYKLAGAGTQNAGLAIGGGVPPTNTASDATEEYDGSTWTAGGALGTARKELAGCGTQTAGLAFGGRTTVLTNATEEYNGTSWTAGGNLGSNKYLLAGAGIQTAGLAFGGYFGTSLNATEEYDGSTWTAGGNMGTARYQLAGAGLQTSALAFGGVTPFTNATESYNGTSWRNSATLATARSILGGAGADNTAALAFGGSTPSITKNTEEYNQSVNIITAAAWASGGNLPTGRSALSGAGTQTAGLGFGGYTGPPGDIPSTVVTLKYDGSSWTTSGNLNTARQAGGPSSAGSQTAALYFGGATAFSTPTDATKIDATESFNGSTWSTLPAVMNTKRLGMGGSGTQTSALAFGGGVSPNANPTTATESYNGSTWTSVNAMNTTRRYISGCGTQTATLAASGFPGGGVEEWDGSTWTTSNNSNQNRQNKGALCGVQTNALLGGGGSGGTPFAGATEEYDGTSWVTAPTMATGRYNIGAASASSANASMGFGGTGFTTSTEEFTGETSATNVVTISSS